jgi:hypothetical protein
MVRLTITLTAASARTADELLEGLRFLVVSTRLEPRCLECSAWGGPDATAHYVESWETEADMRERVLSDRFTLLLAVVEGAEEAHVRFDFVTETRGLDYVAEVREQPN